MMDDTTADLRQMQKAEVWVALDEIKRYADASDSEGAHIEQDHLYEAVLQHIADGAENAAELAKIALKARDIDFSRWYS